MRYLSAPVLLVFALSSCGPQAGYSGKNGASAVMAHNAPENFPADSLLEGVKITSDTSLSFALYLPSSYSSGKKYPLLVFFDPHGAGAFPLGKYRSLASRYGFILAGSNNSKNGLPWDVTGSIADKLMNDLKSRISVDEKRIYLAGFSGGARVAGLAAMTREDVAGMIGCSAGLPADKKITRKFLYIGIAGDGDFNLNEMNMVKYSLDRMGFANALMVAEGGHRWPGEKDMEEAFLWLRINEMKTGTTEKDEGLISTAEKFIKDRAQANVKSKRMLYAAAAYARMADCLGGIADTLPYARTLSEIRSGKEYRQEFELQKKLAKEEFELQQSYLGALKIKPGAWWEMEVARVNSLMKASGYEERMMYKRILGYLSLVLYMNCTAALNEGDWPRAFDLINLYSLVDPPNPEHAYLMAVVYAVQKNPERALQYMEEAAHLGFNDTGRMDNDPMLSSLRMLPAYPHLREKVKGAVTPEQ